MRLKETHIGSLLLVRSMGLKEEGGARVGLGRVMGLGFGRKSARKVCYCSIMYLSRWGMVEG